MGNWHTDKQQFIETPTELVNFFNEINEVCKKYNLSISHEDGHGSFIIEQYDEYNINWLKGATIDYTNEPTETP